jgi:hypothetical protein
VKSTSIALATAGLVAATLIPLAGTASAVAPELTVVPDGVKKAKAMWSDATDQTATPFDAYLVTVDDDSTNGAFEADRSRFVDDAALDLSAQFDDLSVGTKYYVNLYAVDFTGTDVVVVPPSGGDDGAPLDSFIAEGSTLTIVNDLDVVLAGNTVTVSGTLTGDAGALEGEPVTVQQDPYPFDGDWQSTTVNTTTDGKWSKGFAPPINTRYRALYEPAEGIGGWTRNVTVEVRKKITVALDPGATVSSGTTIKYSGKLGGDPAFFQPPASDPAVKACLQRLVGGTWSGSIKCVTVEANGTYLLKHKPGADQDGKYRIFSGMGPYYADSWSKAKNIKVN